MYTKESSKTIRRISSIIITVIIGIITSIMNINIARIATQDLYDYDKYECTLRVMLLENDMRKIWGINVRNIYIYIPTLLFLFAAIVIITRKMIRTDKRTWGLLLIRYGRVRKWCSVLTVNAIVYTCIYVSSYIALICLFGFFNEIDIWFFACIIMRIFFLLWIFYFTYCVFRKYNKSISLFSAILVMVIIVIIDFSIESICIVSYCREVRPMILGFVLNIGMLIVARCRAVHSLNRKEIL